MGVSACQQCRKLKHRCDWSSGAQACDRCKTFNIACDVSQIANTKPRKRKEESRIDSLEKSIDELQALIQQMQSTKVSHDSTSPRSNVSDEVIPSAEQHRLFDFCRYQMMNFWKLVKIPPNKTYEDVVKERPILAKTMVASAALTLAHAQAEALQQIAKDAALHALFEQSERSMQLLQSFLLFNVWTPTFTKESILRFGTYVNLALQVASELDREKTAADDWDKNEYSRAWMHIFLSHTSGKLLQDRSIKAQLPWTKDLFAHSEHLLRSDCNFEQNAALVARFMAAARGVIDPSVAVTRDMFEDIRSKFDMLRDQFQISKYISAEIGTNAAYLFLLEYWSETIAIQKNPADVERAHSLALTYIKELYKILDDLMTMPLDGVPTFILVRPLTALVSIGRICHLLEIKDVFEQALVEIRSRLEIMGMVSNFCAQSLSRIDTIIHWYKTSAALRSTPLSVITSEPAIVPPAEEFTFDWDLFIDAWDEPSTT